MMRGARGGGGLSFTGVSHGHACSHALPSSTYYYRTPKLGPIKATAAAAEAEIEIRVCVNRTCRRQGSMETLQILTGIAPPDATITSCGCLGRCGAGPNLVVLPRQLFIGHCGTAARAADVMATIFDCDSDYWSRSLGALALRKGAEIEMDQGNLSQADILLSQAIDLKPFGGVHIIYKDRSAARLAMGHLAEALGDAKEALVLAPNYHEAYVCEGDIFMGMEEFDAARKSYSMALELNPSFRRSKSFKLRIAKLEEKISAVNVP